MKSGAADRVKNLASCWFFIPANPLGLAKIIIIFLCPALCHSGGSGFPGKGSGHLYWIRFAD
ncbi:MAG TPA: hypothetical protein PLK28_02880 [Candidatus Rifleibacterium sp.]|nr:hypothetical protein [Candidatus Rifleibacterium sp.]